MSPLPDELVQIVSLLLRKLELKGLHDEARLLRAGKTDIVEEGYDNWNGGQYYYTLYIDVPIEVFVELEDRLPQLEKVLHAEATSLRRGEGNEHIGSVTIRSTADLEFSSGTLASARHSELPLFWTKEYFRVFISHPHTVKAYALQLKLGFIKHCVSSFVAHEDIEPTKEWQLEIEKALGTMETIVALITPEFSSSKWCDQEVGIGIGLNRLVVPVRLGLDPYGFFGKYQGLAAHNKTPDQLASEIFTIIVKHDLTRLRMASVLVDRFAASNTYAESKSLMDYLERVPSITSEMAVKMRQAVIDNGQVRDSFYVPGRVERLLERHGHRKTI